MIEKKDENYFYGKIDQYTYELSFSQQDFIKRSVDNLSLVELMREVFKEPTLAERSPEYDNIRRYVAKIKRDIGRPSFTEDQISFIEGNAHVMKAFELAKHVFPDKKIVPLSRETQLISQYLLAIGIGEMGADSNEYRAPKASSSLCRKINVCNPEREFDANDLSPFQRRCVDGLKNYLSSSRFAGFMRVYRKKANGPELCALFEEEFIKAVHDKPDLNTEELNMYINLCSEYVNIQVIIDTKTLLENKINTALFDSEDESKQKLYMSWVDLIQNMEADLNNCKKRCTDYQSKLSSTRSDRMKKQAQVNESLAKLVEEWKSKEGRERALIVAEAQKLLVKDEIKRYETASEYLVNILGISEDEILRN